MGVLVKGLDANEKYYVRARARNKDDVRTEWSPGTTYKYTKIEGPTGQAFNIYYSSVGVSAEGSFTTKVGDSWLQFRRGANVSNWLTTNEYVWEGLSANTTYQFYVRTKNSDGSAVNDWVGPSIRATRIEQIYNLQFSIYNSSIGVKTTDELSNLANGSSGIWYGCYTNSNYTGLVASTWTKSTDYFWVTGLSTNTIYYFKAVSYTHLTLPTN